MGSDGNAIYKCTHSHTHMSDRIMLLFEVLRQLKILNIIDTSSILIYPYICLLYYNDNNLKLFRIYSYCLGKF